MIHPPPLLYLRYPTVYYLDSDPSHPEFTPPGLVSLHELKDPIFGPSYTHHLPSVKSFFIGATSALNNPGRYLASLQSLIDLYRLEISSTQNNLGPPLVVNTSGWVKGLGSDLLTHFLKSLNPNFVFHLYSSSASRNVSQLSSMVPISTKTIEFKVESSEFWGLGSGHETQLALTAYLTQAKNNTIQPFPWTLPSLASPKNLWWNCDRSFSNDETWPLPWTCFELEILDSQVPWSQSLWAVNGTLVALCCKSPIPLTHSTDSIPSLPSIQSSSTLLNKISSSSPPPPQLVIHNQPSLEPVTCLGLGILHSIHPGIFHVLVPVGYPCHLVSRCNWLVRGGGSIGALDVPIGLLHQSGRSRRSLSSFLELPYSTTLVSEGKGGKVMRVI